MSETDVRAANDLIEWIKTPSPRKWLSARILTLLSHYYVSQSDERVAQAAAEDWIEILRELPPWAVSNACRKYLAGDNRRRKPTPGDILDLAQRELWFVNKAAKSLCEREAAAMDTPPKPLTAKEREYRRKRVAELTTGFGKMPVDDPTQRSPEKNNHAGVDGNGGAR